MYKLLPLIATIKDEQNQQKTISYFYEILQITDIAITLNKFTRQT